MAVVVVIAHGESTLQDQRRKLADASGLFSGSTPVGERCRPYDGGANVVRSLAHPQPCIAEKALRIVKALKVFVAQHLNDLRACVDREQLSTRTHGIGQVSTHARK